jgi:hypothetical protein
MWLDPIEKMALQFRQAESFTSNNTKGIKISP